ncbi:MAG: PhzF family phenazine biosynthesis protein [Candidatus Adiutrix sp.]|jgi:PhzF family phenazine biosynthesis protein|nr:PhzF family phenazine biosynthesis protein [Candidatus Adiutrix sp.]
MIAKMFLVDAFVDGPFSGGRAAVVLLRHFGQEALLQNLAAEIGTPMTVYALRHDGAFITRYFTPKSEVSAAGNYAALAAAHVLFDTALTPSTQPVRLLGHGGEMSVSKSRDPEDGRLVIAVPRRPMEPRSYLKTLTEALALAEGDILAAGEAPAGTRLIYLKNMELLKNIPSGRCLLTSRPQALTLSAPLNAEDSPGYALRHFAYPAEAAEMSINLDEQAPLALFWGRKLGLSRLQARLMAPRSGLLWADLAARPDSVLISGRVTTVFKADPALKELTGDIRLDLLTGLAP